MIKIELNGEAKEFDEAMTLAEMLGTLGFQPERVALERNREIVPRSLYGEIKFDEGDKIEVVHFIGGGDHSTKASHDDQFTVGDKIEIVGLADTQETTVTGV
ncbi:MAG: sulfur carrier protein ThiS, partial [Pseudomonadota bacterium]